MTERSASRTGCLGGLPLMVLEMPSRHHWYLICKRVGSLLRTWSATCAVSTLKARNANTAGRSSCEWRVHSY
eukprot:1151312-Pelagomonas_calceolata.AAC.4